MAITAQKFLPQGKTGGGLAVTPKTSLIKSPKEGSNIVFTIQKKIILVDDLLKGTLAEKKKRQNDEIKQKEDDQRAKQEKDQEKPDKDDSEKETPKSLIPKLSFLDGIKKFISEVLVGWLTFNLIKFLPKIIKAVKFLGNIADFVIGFGGKILDGLVTFIDIGYDAYEKTSEWVGDTFGKDKQKQFENFASTLTKFLNVAIIAAMVGSKMGMLGMGGKGAKKGIKRRFDPQRAKKLARVKNLKKIKADRLLRVKKFGRLRKLAKAKQFVGKSVDLGKNIVKTGGKVAQTVTKGVKTAVKTATPVIKSAAKTATKLGKTGLKTATKVASTATKGITTAAKTATPVIKSAAKTATTTATKLGKTGLKTGLKGLKALKKIVSPIVKKIPFIGALIDFALNYFVFKEPLGKSAFMAIGAGVGAWLGGILGTLIPVPFVGTTIGAFVGGVGGDKLAGALYDAIFKEKKPKEDKKDDEKKGTNKISKEMKIGKKTVDLSKVMGGLSREDYDALDTMDRKRLNRRMTTWKDQNKEEWAANIKGNANNIVSTNGISNKVNNISSYDEEEETVVIKSGSETGGDVVPETETKESITPVSVGGGGGDSEVSDALYKSG